MRHWSRSVDMSEYGVPIELAESGYEFEFLANDHSWRFGRLEDGKWFSEDEVLGRLEDTRAIRCPEPLVRYFIDQIVEAYDSEEFESDLFAVEGPLPTKLAAYQRRICVEATVAAIRMVPEEEGEHPGLPELDRIRRRLILDAAARSWQPRPASQTVMGYVVRNRRGQLVEECGVMIAAFARANVREKVGPDSMGLLFGDGSIDWGHPVLREILVCEIDEDYVAERWDLYPNVGAR